MSDGGKLRKERRTAALVLVYIVCVLVIDTLASQGVRFVIDWRVLRGNVYGADVFKWTAWFVVPFLFSLRTIDWGYFGFGRWKRIDWGLLIGVAGVGGLIMLLLPHLPEVGEYYRGWASRPMEVRTELALRQVLWTFSWLTGWEFMHRYVLPRAATSALGERGWLVALIGIPLIEGLYHVIQSKPLIECVGVAAMSAVFTVWVLRRRNAMLPFLGHLIIELELIAFLFFTS